MGFNEMNIIPSILKALKEENYKEPTPIQQQTIAPILAGRDILGIAQTGTGKTAAFAVPTLQLLAEHSKSISADHKKRKIRALVLTPTRELATQIHDSFLAYGRYTRLRTGLVFGGVSQKSQEEMLEKGVDLLIATPGRLIDLIQQDLVELKHIRILILDEADRMLDMGFIRDVKRIIAHTPGHKQTLLFSATVPTEIRELTYSLLKNPVKVSITPDKPAVEGIAQSVYYVDRVNKRKLLIDLLKNPFIVSALVFSRTRHGADRIARDLVKHHINAQSIHGDKSQQRRQQVLGDFKNRKTRVLVATDIAARGIDIDELSHVINFDLPEVPETYIHRIGRTGRAGNTGISISFCDFHEKKLLKSIEKLMDIQLTEVKDHPYPLIITSTNLKETIRSHPDKKFERIKEHKKG